MPRTIVVTVPPDRLKAFEGIVGLSLQRNGSISPPGDILTIQANNHASPTILKLLEELQIPENGLILTSRLSSLVSSRDKSALHRETSETTWEEMLNLLREQSNPTVNYLALMFGSGGIAAVGFWTNTFYLLLAGQVLGPHYEPLARIPFGLVVGRLRMSLRGVIATLVGFSVMALGAALTLALLLKVDPKSSLDLDTRSWVQYFSSTTNSSIVEASVAAITGAVIIASQQLVLLTGVYIGLNLVPAMSLVGMALSLGDWQLTQKSFVHWCVDAGLVIGWGALVLWIEATLLASSSRSRLRQLSGIDLLPPLS